VEFILKIFLTSFYVGIVINLLKKGNDNVLIANGVNLLIWNLAMAKCQK